MLNQPALIAKLASKQKESMAGVGEEQLSTRGQNLNFKNKRFSPYGNSLLPKKGC